MFGRLPWFALERRRRALRFLVFFDIGPRVYGRRSVSQLAHRSGSDGIVRTSRLLSPEPNMSENTLATRSPTRQDTTMSTTELTLDTFESTVTADGITFVDFWAEWCGPCKMFGPIFEETASENPDVTFAKVNTEAEQQLAGSLGIMSIPTIMIFRDGVQLFAQPGALPKGALDDLLRQVRELDMDEVRAQLADGADSPS